jgi:cytochrome c551/c552
LFRLLKVSLILLIAIPLLAWGGFRLWLVNQPDAFRASIEDFGTLEFLEVVYDYAFPSPLPDRANWGRRDYPGRGHSPWVMRSSLDGRPRMIAIALAEELWLAYSTETASIHQFWRGDVDYTGPVYDAQHGFEPTSRGATYLRPPTSTAWRVQSDAGWQPAEIKWLGHGFDPDTGSLWIRFALLDTMGKNRRVVTEWPERAFPDEPATVALERRFEFSAGPPIALQLERGGGSLEIESGAEAHGNLLAFDGSPAHLIQRFEAPPIPIDRSQPEALASDPFANTDCHTCHNVRERVVGPAWSEIALRYEGANREITLSQLAARIQEGSEGHWGSVAMTPHPDLSRAEAAQFAQIILDTEPSEAPTVVVEDGGAVATWTFGSQTESPPDRLHPSLTTFPIDPPEFTPRVGGLAWLPDGRLGVATWDRDGSVFAIEGWQNNRSAVRIERIAEGLHEPLGLAVANGGVYVMQKQEVTQLLDHDDDGWTDEYRTITNGWRVTSNFHEFGFGLAALGNHLYGSLSVCVLTGGKSCREQTPDRGTIFRLSLATKEIEFIARGLRTPNGLATTPGGELLVTDNQGDWLPASKLIRVRPGDDYGWRAPGQQPDLVPPTPPTLWLPQNEVGNSPTQPMYLTRGPYSGHILFGDIFNGGLKRAALEEVDGQLQGAAFHFTGGLEGPVNRLLEVPEGGFIVGQIGSRGNWGERGKDWYGLEYIRMAADPAFECMRVSATESGFDLHFSRPLSPEHVLGPDDFRLSDWFYVPSEIYGGPKYDLRDLEVERVRVSSDRRTVSISIADLKAGRVVYLHLGSSIRSERDEALWVNEAWYTMTVLPERTRLDPRGGADLSPSASKLRPNTLSREEKAMGWRLLFDGHSFDGWKIYKSDDDPADYWKIEDGALEFTRDVSFAGLVLNHLNPFTTAAADLMTQAQFGDFELSIDWRISEGGNSGVFYLVPDEESSLAWDRGLEMQVLDNAAHRDGQIERHRAGDLYDLQSLARDAALPVGEWNNARIRVEGDHIRHWLNGQLLADIHRGSADWTTALADSKFAGIEAYGLAQRGHITLQDHGDPVWFRNIKIRELPAR